MPALKTRLALLYHDRLPDIINDVYPDERFATCSTCVVCQSPQSPYVNTKCCAYYPSLPNFLVGGVLSDQRLERGRQVVRAVIGERSGVTPYGLLRPESRALPERPLTQAEADALLCPYYDAGQCGIWDHREHLCSTYFCYSTGGQHGKAFWEAVREYLRHVERELSLHALRTLGWPIEKLRLTNPLADWRPATTPAVERRQREAWRDWWGREADLYVECHRIVMALDGATIESILGWKGRELGRRMRELLEAFRQSAIPELLQVSRPVRITPDGDTAHISGAAAAIRIPRVAAAFIEQFDGTRSTTAVVRAAAAISVDLATDVVQLRDAGILLDV